MRLNVREMTVFAMLGAVMYVSKIAMEGLPNVHLLGVFTIAITLVYRKKALYAVYTYVFLNGLFGGFSIWWIPYLYIWTVLWAITMILPKNIPAKAKPIVYMVVCSLHGFLFGTLYAPAQALLFGLDFKQTISWIVAGFPYDCIHGVSNFFCGLLIIPIVKALEKAEKSMKH